MSKNPHAVALGRKGGKASPRRHAWRNMSAEERTANARAAASARWSAMSESERKAQLAKVRQGRKPKA